MDDVTEAPEASEAPEADAVEAPPEAETSPEAEVEGAQESEGETEDTPEPTFTVKVKGQEIQVTQDELQNGYQRQADYTRNQQALAAEKAQLAQAQMLWDRLNDDPASTLKLLQEHYSDILEDNQQELDPDESRLREVESFIEQQRQVQLDQQIQSQLADLHNRYGDFIDDDLFEHALELDVYNLEAALAHMLTAQDRKAKDDAAVDRKRTAPPVSGRGKAAESTGTPQREIRSVADALRASLKEAGLDAMPRP